MSLAGIEDQIELASESFSSIVPEGGEGTPPYGQYPTETRFRRPDYKFYKTLDDSKEFQQRVQPLPPPPPPPQQQQQQQHESDTRQTQQHRSSNRRPATAYARWPPRHQHLQQQQPREPEPGWRPIYPEPDLTTPRPSRPVTAPSTRSSAVAAAVSDNVEKLDVAKAAVDKKLSADASPNVTSTASKIRPVQLAVVDFLEARRQPSPPAQQPPPPQTASSAARFYRPKTAPSRVATASSGIGLQIQGHRLLPSGRERATSAKLNASSIGGVRDLSEAYDRALAVHGWRMEVPGDPFGIKQHLIPDRKPVSVTVPEPTVKPLPPRIRRTNRFTFFHTTAPRVVMSFDIHPNFTSEQFSKARSALIKQGKWDYRYRDFSFMY